jgi:hypothetical protein
MTPEDIGRLTDRKRRVVEVRRLRMVEEPKQHKNLYSALADLTGLTYNQIAADLRDWRRWYGDKSA